MNRGPLTSPHSKPMSSKALTAVGQRTVLMTSIMLLLIMGSVTSTWAGNRLTSPSGPIHLAGASIHVGPGGIHLGIGGHRHGFRGPHRHFRNHFGQRHLYNFGRSFYRPHFRQDLRPHYFGGHQKRHRHFKGGRHFRRH